MSNEEGDYGKEEFFREALGAPVTFAAGLGFAIATLVGYVWFRPMLHGTKDNPSLLDNIEHYLFFWDKLLVAKIFGLTNPITIMYWRSTDFVIWVSMFVYIMLCGVLGVFIGRFVSRRLFGENAAESE